MADVEVMTDSDTAASTTPSIRTIPNEDDADYFVNPTVLFKSIEDQEWQRAMSRLGEDPAESATWVVRKGFDADITWRRLPIHEAFIRQAPDDLVMSLLTSFPPSCSYRDANGRLPLHHACVHGASAKVVHEMLMTYPESINSQDVWGKTPLDCIIGTAAKPDKISVIEALEKGSSFYAQRVIDIKIAEGVSKEIVKAEKEWIKKNEAQMEVLTKSDERKNSTIIAQQEELVRIKKELDLGNSKLQFSVARGHDLEEKVAELNKNIEDSQKEREEKEAELIEERKMTEKVLIEEKNSLNELLERSVAQVKVLQERFSELQNEVVNAKTEFDGRENALRGEKDALEARMNEEKDEIKNQIMMEKDQLESQLTQEKDMLQAELVKQKKMMEAIGTKLTQDKIVLDSKLKEQESKNDELNTKLLSAGKDLTSIEQQLVSKVAHEKNQYEKISKLEAEVSHLKEEKTKMEERESQFSDEKRTLEVKLLCEMEVMKTKFIEERNATVPKFQGEKQAIQDKLDTTAAHASLLQKKVKELEGELSQARTDYSDMKKKLIAEKESLIDEFEEEKSVFETERDLLKEDVYTLNTSITTMKIKIHGDSVAIESLKKELSDVIIAKEAETSRNTTMIAELETERDDLQANVKELESNVEEMEKTVQSLSTALDETGKEKDERIVGLETELSDLKEVTDKVKQELKEEKEVHDSDVTKLQTRLKEVESAYENLDKSSGNNMANLQASLKSTTEDKAGTQVENVNLKVKLASANTSIKKLQKNIAGLKSDKEDLNADIEKLIVEKGDFKNRGDKLQKQVNVLKATMRTIVDVQLQMVEAVDNEADSFDDVLEKQSEMVDKVEEMKNEIGETDAGNGGSQIQQGETSESTVDECTVDEESPKVEETEDSQQPEEAENPEQKDEVNSVPEETKDENE